MDEEEQNYCCLVLLLSRVGLVKLRQFFIDEWNSLGGFVPWTDCHQNGVDLLTKYIPRPTYEIPRVKSGDTTKWDITLFVKVLLYSRPPFVQFVNKPFVDALLYLKETNNLLHHLAFKKISSAEFDERYRDLCSALILLGATTEELKKVKEDVCQLPRNKRLEARAIGHAPTTSLSFLTKEKANYTKLARLVVDIGTSVLRDVFDSIHPPPSLHGLLWSEPIFSILKNLRTTRVLNMAHWEKLYPASGKTPETKNFDIFLLFLLLRNICGLKCPNTGWCAEPLSTDFSMEADIVRVKRARNCIFGHTVELAMSDVNFESHWNEIELAFDRLGQSRYRRQIENLRYGLVEQDEISVKEIQKLSAKLDAIGEKQEGTDIDELRQLINGLQGKLDRSIKAKRASEEPIVPAEIIARGTDAIESYRKALDHGEVEIYRARVMIIGQDRAGKTSLKRSLCGLQFIDGLESTVGLEASLCTIDIDNGGTWQKKDGWSLLSYDDVARWVATDIKKSKVNEISEEQKTSNQAEVAKNNVQAGELEAKDQLVYLPETNKESTDVSFSEERDKIQSKQQLRLPEEVESSVIKYLQEKEIGEFIKCKEVTTSILDFAGQHLYYSSHPVFMSHRAVYILVYNLEKDLDDKAKPYVRQGTRDILLDNASNETNLDNILSWLVSVHCLCGSVPDSCGKKEDERCYRRPPVLIVGTHADKLSGSNTKTENVRQVMERKIQDRIQDREFEAHVVKPYFAVNNRMSANDEGVKNLTSKINEVLSVEPYIPESVPIRWFHFEKSLQVLVQEKKKSFMPVQELFEIARRVCSVDQAETANMLNFYHDVGIIIKHGDTVVLNVQWLIGLFKSLITIKPYNEQNPKHQRLWRELEKTGRLSSDLINHIFKEWMNCDHESTECECQAKKDILDMMEYFGLISKIIPSDCKKEYCYLVPSHLTSSPEDELKKSHPSSGEPCPLYIRFKDGFIPHGLYFQLICRWCSIYGSQKRPNLFPIEPKLFRNAAKFVLDNNSKVIMTVVCCKSTIKVCLHSNRENKTGIDFKAVEIKQLVQKSLVSLKEKCPWYQGLQYDLCIRCPLCALNATEKKEGQPFGDDNCLHPATDDEEFFCEVKDEWPEVLGLHHWFSRPTIEPSDRQSAREDVRVSNGLFVVINIAKFDQRLKKLSDRIGSEYDEKAMVELFGDYFGFEVVNLSNKDGAVEIKQELRNISFDKKYEDKDCFVLCIMSHGDKGVFYTADCQTIECNEIVSYFENGMCKSFRGKPKLFIFQACRGGDVDRGVAVTDFPSGPKGNKESQKSCAIHQQSSERERVIPCKANILQAFCCSEGCISCRDKNSGTYYIQSLVRIFRKFAATKDVVRMLEMVNKDVSSKKMKLTNEPQVKQSPNFTTSLGDVVYFCTK